MEIKNANTDILKELNSEQKKAITHKQGPLLIVAGAGTGKTHVITRRIAHLILNEGVKAEEILALTFTNKAAEEMQERVDQLLPYGYVDTWISTFHTFAQRIIEEHGMDIGISSNVELLDQTGQWLLVRQNLDKFDLDYYRPRNNPTKFIKTMLTHFSRLKDEEISPEQYLEHAEHLELSKDDMEGSGGKSSLKHDDAITEKQRIIEIANAYHTYQELLHEHNKMDFGDLINYSLKLFNDRPQVLKEYQNKFKYILVDEFQDTNWAQFDLVKKLALPENNITVVADDDQSIYRFRGASMSNVIQFSREFKDSEQISLIRNYRSGQEILDMSHDIIQLNNPNRLEHSVIASDQRERSNPNIALSHDIESSGNHRDDKIAAVASTLPRNDMKIDKKLIAQTKEKAHIEHLHTKDSSDEARVVAETIIELKKKDAEATWNDFAILVRANSHAELFEEALSNAQVPHQNYSKAGLYKTSLAANIISFFRVLNDYYLSRDMFRLLNLPFLKIAPENIVKMNHFTGRKRIPLYEAVIAPNIANITGDISLKGIETVRTWIAKYSESAKSTKASTLLIEWLHEAYITYLNDLPDAESLEQFRILKALFEHIKEIERVVPDARVLDIVGILEQEIDSGEAGSLPVDLDAGPEMARIMTIHSAKGLEFKYVFITNMVDRRFPTTERKVAITIPDELVKEVLPEGDVHIQEERRLFYVAMTRAKQGLFFTSAENYGGSQKKKLSRFLLELEEVYSQFKVSESPLGGDPKSFLTHPTKTLSPQFKPYIPKRFSFTQLKIFDECPFAYKMQFLLGVALPGKFVFSYGTTVHSTLQQFMQLVTQKSRSVQTDLFGNPSVIASDQRERSNLNVAPGYDSENSDNHRNDKIASPPPEAGPRNDMPPPEELLELYATNWIDDWYDSQKQMKEYKQKGKQALKIFYENLSKQGVPNVLALERGFTIKIGEYVITGKMDRVDSLGGRDVRIIDYKTGNPPKNNKLTIADKRQLLIYQLASEAKGETPKELEYYYFDKAQPLLFLGLDEEKQEVKQWIIDTIDAIHKSDFAPKSQQHFCDYCEEFADLG